jgi:hypothetical protein
MAGHLLMALESHEKSKKLGRPREFTFQHKICHDFESLIWVIVYAMMVHRRNMLAVADSRTYQDFKEDLDRIWGAHSYARLVDGHESLIGSGSSRFRTVVEESWFPDPLEADFFRASMRLVRSQVHDGEPITYEKIRDLFQAYIRKAEQANIPTEASA